MSRTKNAAINSISLFVYQLIHMATGFIIPRVLIGTYGSEVNGLVTSISQILSYFLLAEAGLSSAMIFALYKPLADQDHERISGIVSAGTLFYRQVSAIFFALTILMAFVYSSVVKVSVLSQAEVFLLVLILGGNTTMDFLTIARFRTLLTADQKASVVYGIMSAQNIATAIVIYALAKSNCNIILLRLAVFSCVSIRAIGLWAYVRKRYKYVDYKAKPNKAALNKRWDALYQQAFGIVYNSAPSLILTFSNSNLSILSVYSVYNMFIVAINGILSILANGVVAGFGDLLSRNDMRGLRNAYHQYETAFLTLLSVVYSVSYIMLLPLVRIYTGGFTDVNYIVPTLAILLVVNGYLYNIKTSLGMLIIAAGMYKETRWRITVQGAIVLVFGVVLNMFLPVYGIVIAMMISNVYRCIDMIYYVPKYITREKRNGVYKRWGISLFGLLIVILISETINIAPVTYWDWIGSACIATLIASLVLLLLNAVFNRKDTLGFLGRFLVPLKKRFN